MTRSVRVGTVSLGNGPTKIIVSLAEGSASPLATKAKKLQQSSADIVEWRVDALHSVKEAALTRSFSAIRKATRKPILATFRSKKEGGVADVTAEQYATVVRALLDLEVDAIDIEFRSESYANLLAIAKKRKKTVVSSLHEFTKTPDSEAMLSILRAMEESGADILKLAVMPKSPEDCLRLMETTLSAKKMLSHPLITMSMGGLGVISRLAGATFGSCATFAALGKISAPGQLDIETTCAIVCRD